MELTVKDEIITLTTPDQMFEIIKYTEGLTQIIFHLDMIDNMKPHVTFKNTMIGTTSIGVNSESGRMLIGIDRHGKRVSILINQSGVNVLNKNYIANIYNKDQSIVAEIYVEENTIAPGKKVPIGQYPNNYNETGLIQPICCKETEVIQVPPTVLNQPNSFDDSVQRIVDTGFMNLSEKKDDKDFVFDPNEILQKAERGELFNLDDPKPKYKQTLDFGDMIKQKRIKCKYCGLLFSKNRDCIDHKHVAHPEMYVFKCKICVLLNQPQATYDEEHLLQNHINLSHKIPVEFFDKYEEEFVRRNQQLFRQPQKTPIFGLVQQPQQNTEVRVCGLLQGGPNCACCHGQGFRGFQSDQQQKFKCSFCGKELSCQKFQKIHERQEHPEQFGFKCPRCDYVFRTDNELKEHKRNKHVEYFNEEAISKGFCCHVCNNFYMTAAHLHAHQRNEHMNLFSGVGISDHFQFECPICFMQGDLTIEEMKKHLDAHVE